jgi:diguanylate cyclase (GGDEF)-like protein/PAS domain S-box-containing protein
METAVYKTGLTRLPMLVGAFVALICIGILVLSGVRAWIARETALEVAKAELANLARSLTQHADDTIDLLDASIVGLVVRLEVGGIGADALPDLQRVLVKRKAALNRIYNIIICDDSGNWVATSGTPGPNLSDREFFRHHMQSPASDAFIGQPIISRVSGEWIITVSRRFNHPDGSFGGVVLATTGSDYFAHYYKQFNFDAHSAVALVNASGVILARSPDDGSYVGRDMSGSALFRGPSLSASGERDFKSPLDNMQRVSFYQRSDRFPLLVLASREQDEVLAPWRKAAELRLLGVFGLVILIAVMGAYIVRQLQRGNRMAALLASTEANFRVLAEGSSDMVTRIGLDERVQYASPSSVRILGWSPDRLIGTTALAGVRAEDLPQVEEAVAALKRGELEETRITYRARHREKSEVWVESTLRITRNDHGRIDGFVAITRDMTQQKTLEGKLATLATEDGLTGLANRRRFDERLLEEWSRAYRERTCLSLLMIDLDHFKQYNDEYGHPAGDECLRAVAGILAAEAKRTTDLAARYGGEEFAMLLPNTDAAGCERIGERIMREIRDAGIPHKLNFPSRVVTASLGGAVCRPGVERSAGHASLIDAADRALYAAKDDGRDQLAMAKPAVRQILARSVAGESVS